MARIIIEADVPDDMVDLDDPSGLTEAAYLEVSSALTGCGLDDVDIKADA